MKSMTKREKPVRAKDKINAVKFMREQRNRISRDIMDLSPEQIVKYFDKKRGETRE
jgi:hypothetical protein